MKRALLLATAATALTAGGYRIPENSINSLALAAAYAANANGADATYYNPANMVFGDAAQKAEAALTYIGLTGVHFNGSAPQAGVVGTDTSGSDAEPEHFFVPTLHYISPAFGDWRFGASMLSPGGLSKRWNDQPARSYAWEVTVQTIEFNPTVAYRISPELSVGGGLRALYVQGVVKSGSIGSRDMAGDGFAFGYNLALSYRPTEALKLAATYRSGIEFNIEGDAKLYFPDDGAYNGTLLYDTGGSVSLPLPAVLQVAAAYTFNEGTSQATTVEFVYEKDYWSAFKDLDFDYDTDIGALAMYFDDPIPKNWKDTNVYRLGVTQGLDAWTLMAGIAIDETPIPEKTLNFELPDANAVIFSAGARYRMDDAWNLGGGILYDHKEDRRIDGTVNDNNIDGTFTNTAAILVTLGAEYRF
ncbi:outer membrane protein transport protein [Sulfurimonas sp. HSL-3221]|uniref:OmpP1/FadL family transporter n=1 Tax=Sulfurimonadaceae TaxID=2771471 RepID=UPI001E57178F|nr:outer membrane protein transport protein [Sulfurimonas sp. HSL-3221]UFS62245.1 outer membrane protein transport protein [Sulfurimonas sp. HSL-3221]